MNHAGSRVERHETMKPRKHIYTTSSHEPANKLNTLILSLLSQTNHFFSYVCT
jgi:hypothetical protein